MPTTVIISVKAFEHGLFGKMMLGRLSGNGVKELQEEEYNRYITFALLLELHHD